MTEDIVARIKRHEGFCGVPKPDAKGAWVVGWGHDLTELQAQQYAHGITEEEAMEFLESDINTAQKGVNSLQWTSSLSRARQEALIELAFWIGVAGLMKFQHMLACLKAGDFDGAAQALLNSLLHRQIPGRAEELAGLLLTPSS